MNDAEPPKNILDKINEKQKEYFNINISDIINSEDELNIGEIEKQNQNAHNMFLLQENKNPEIIDNLKQIPLEEERIEMKKIESEKFDISDISLIE